MYLVISASPNTDGLTAACVKATLDGLLDGGAEVQHIDLCKMHLEHCRQCGNGWGICRNQHTCVIDDQLAEVQQAMGSAQ